MSSFTGQDISTINSILKDDYRGPIVEMLNSKTLLLHRIEATAEFTEGRRALFPLHTGRNEGLGARPEADNTTASDLPQAGKQEYEDATYKMTHLYGAIQFSGPAVAAARNNEGAFARLVESEIDGLVRDASRDINRQLFGPKSGELGLVITGPGGTDEDGVTLSTSQVVLSTRQFIRKNMRIAFYSPGTSGAIKNGGTIRTVSSVTRLSSRPNYARVTFDGALNASTAVAAADLATREKSYGNEIFGLVDIISDGNPQNILSGAASERRYVGNLDRGSAGFEFWQSNIIDQGNAAFSDTLFQDAIDLSEVEGDGDLSIFITDHRTFNTYGNSLLSDRRYPTEGSRFNKLDGGFRALEYDEVPVVKDRDCQFNTIWGLAEDRIKFLHMADWDWMDKDGSVLSRVQGKDAYEATLFKYCELAINDAKDHVKIANVDTVI